jgi:tRNA threonylcarbamoyladenosine biosynthesis protein TsaB
VTVLGIETATPVCAAGLAGENGWIAEARIFAGNTHAEQLPELVRDLLARARIPAERLDGIAVSTGPGSYTGLRIGMAFAKGMAFSLDKPLAGVATMDALVSVIPRVFPHVCVMIPSRKGEVFRGLYRGDGERWRPAGECVAAAQDKLGEGLPEGDVLFIGEGSRIYRSAIEAQCGKPHFFPDAHSLPSGASVAAEGRARLISGPGDDCDALVPFYMKAFQGVK